MRPNLGCYQNLTYPEPFYTPMHTPNIDALAAESMLFSNAFVSKPFCGPSRACILTGRRPHSTRVMTNSDDFRDRNPDIVTLPQFFLNRNYWTMGYGKVKSTL